MHAAALSALLLACSAAAAQAVPSKSIVNTSGLGFGRFVAASGGAVTVTPTGARTRTGAVLLLPSPADAATFGIVENGNGNDKKVYVLTLPPNGSVSLVSGANQMPVNNFTSNVPNGAPMPSNTQSVTVGATLQVGPNQAPGTYSGSFQVTLEYQ